MLGRYVREFFLINLLFLICLFLYIRNNLIDMNNCAMCCYYSTKLYIIIYYFFFFFFFFYAKFLLTIWERARFRLVWFTLKCVKAPEDIIVERSLENSCIWGQMYRRKAKLFHRPIIMMVKSLTPARWSCIAKLVLIECVPTLLGRNPIRAARNVWHVARRCVIISEAWMRFGPLSVW